MHIAVAPFGPAALVAAGALEWVTDARVAAGAIGTDEREGAAGIGAGEADGAAVAPLHIALLALPALLQS